MADNLPTYASPWIFLSRRDLDSPQVDNSHILTARQNYIQQVLALTAACTSVFSATVASYWFVKMRRSFRHHLIELLIQSDLLKSLWYLINPVVALTQGTVQSSSDFCQASGFMTALGIEASDFAILMISIHTALCIYRPASFSRTGEGGLYMYRYIAYAGWIAFPVLMASLAFVNSDDAYTSQGTFCYLPLRPFWYRLALSWIPRYCIFLTISVIYSSIYIYVYYKFKGFKMLNSSSSGSRGSQGASASQTSDSHHKGGSGRRLDSQGLPTIPELNHHGHVTHSDLNALGPSPGNQGQASPSSVQVTRPTEVSTNDQIWKEFSFSDPIGSPVKGTEEAQSVPPGTTDADPVTRSYLADSPGVEATPAAFFSERSDMSRSTRQQSETFTNSLTLVDSRGKDFSSAEMERKRREIRRQLRFLFIYPLVYMLSWFIPFISHILQFTTKYSRSSPFALSCITSIVLALQCAIDCWLFSLKERPWRHIPGSDGTIWSSFLFWKHDSIVGFWSNSERSQTGSAEPGRSRVEMASEARRAYQRRDEEAKARKDMQKAVEERRRLSLARRGGRTERDWWEKRKTDYRPDSPVDLESGGHRPSTSVGVSS